MLKNIELGFGITQIDTEFNRPAMAACYLLEHQDEVAIIETGTQHTVDIILSVLSEKKLTLDQVKYIIPTHVHLDHAGGVGKLMKLIPHAQLVIHPKGARHMIDPSKLQAGATAVYGEAVFQKTYGDLIPVAEDRIVTANDEFEIDFGEQRKLIFLDTPGHANHHFCVYDTLSDGIFSGDTFGLAYNELTNHNGPFIFPTTTPVQFNPEAMKGSIQRLIQLNPKCFYLTHFGRVENPKPLADVLLKQIDDFVKITMNHAHDENPQELIFQDLMTYLLDRLDKHECSLKNKERRNILEADVRLNAQGLEVWLSRQNKTI